MRSRPTPATVAIPSRRDASGWRRRGEAGVWATLLALAPAFLLAAVLGVPSPLEPVTQLIVRLTPVAISTALIGALGGLTRTFALLGALALTLPIGIGLALLVPDGPVPGAQADESAPESVPLAEGPAGENAPTGLRPPGPPARTGDAVTTSASTAVSPPVSPSVSSVRPFGDLSALRVLRAYFASSAIHVSPRWLAVAALAVGLSLPLALAADYPGEASAALALGALYMPALWLATRLRVHHRGTMLGAMDLRTSRRAFLRTMASGSLRVAGFLALSSFDLWSGAAGDLLGRGETPRGLFAFAPPGARAPGFPVAGEEPEVTPAAAFYVMSKNDVDPQIAPRDWTLRLDGAVVRPLTLTYDKLRALPRTDEYVTLRCVSNPVAGHLMSTAYFSGVPLVRLLALAALRPDAGAVMLHAPDGYDEPLPLAVALDPRTLVAYGMNGESLARTHGGPARAVVPGYYGFKHVKWLDGVTVLSRPDAGYWERNGWTAARVHSVARIDVARHVGGGTLLVGGVAYTGTRGVSAVQLRVDGGAWQAAALNVPPLSAMTWVQWRRDLALAPGTHTITARVVDGAGQPQDAREAWIFPGGARGLHTVTVTI